VHTARNDKFALVQLVDSQVIHCHGLMLHMYACVPGDREQSAACKDEQLSDEQDLTAKCSALTCIDL